MVILNGQTKEKVKEYEIRKINNFILDHWKEVEKSLSLNGRPAWMFKSGHYFYLSEKGKIKPVSIRELIEKGYNFLTEKGFSRFSIWQITKDDMLGRIETEKEKDEVENNWSQFWSDKMVKKIGPPKSFKLMNSIK